MVAKDVFSQKALASWITKSIDSSSDRAKRANNRAKAKVGPLKSKKESSKFKKQTKVKAMPWKKALARAGPEADAKAFFRVLLQAKECNPGLFVLQESVGSQ